MKKLLKSEQGFTLVELMVVVAIIGILSAIAVPNFKKYQAKSKQSEAKIQLAALYNTEVGSNADYDTYATCLLLMGYEQSPRGYYAIGFASGFDVSSLNAAYSSAGCTTGSTITAASSAPVASDIAYVPLTQLAVVSAQKATTLASLPSTGMAQNTFTAGAAGSISTNSTTPKDQWTITQTKALSNTAPGY